MVKKSTKIALIQNETTNKQKIMVSIFNDILSDIEMLKNQIMKKQENYLRKIYF